MRITDNLTPAEFYNKGLTDRSPFEARAEKFALLTIPAIFRKEGSSGADDLDDEIVQSLGAKGVKKLSSEIGMAAFPPASTAFTLTPDSKALSDLTAENPDKLSEIYRLTSFEQERINKRLDALKTRKIAFKAAQEAIVVGSCVIEKKPNGYKMFKLRSFVVRLDDMGEADAICVLEELMVLPESLRQHTDEKKTDAYKLYTMVERDYDTTDRWFMNQMLEDEYVGGEVSYTSKTVPFRYLGWEWTEGEKYHRPFVEDNYGDLTSYNDLTKVLVKGSLIASKSITFVDERGGRTSAREVAKSKNGAVLIGKSDDVTSFQHGKNYDFQTAENAKREFASSISDSFMIMQFRDAERVTQEEIQQRQKEIEKSLVSPYVTFNQALIEACVNWAMKDVGAEFKAIDVDIIAGVDAMGRSAEAQKLDMFMNRAVTLGLNDWIKDEELLGRYARYDSIDPTNLIKTGKEVAAEQQAAQQAAVQAQGQASMAESAGQSMGQQAASAAVEQQQQQQ